MASNYPDGVSGNEPQIAGETHYRDCPMSDDFEMSLEFEDVDADDVLALVRAADDYLALPSNVHIREAMRVALKPLRFLLECRCAHIRDGLADAETGV